MELLSSSISVIRAFLAAPWSRRGRHLARLRKTWAQDIPRDREMALIAIFHEQRGGSRCTVDGKTWQDLAMDQVFAKLDRTVSMPGRQVLYEQMRTYEDDESVLAERARQHALFRTDSALREEIQLFLTCLDDRRTAWIASLLLKDLPEMPRYVPLLYLSSCLSLACSVGIFFWQPLILPAMVLMLLNFVLNETYGRRIAFHLFGFIRLNTLLGAARGLAGINGGCELPQLDRIREIVPLLTRLRRKLGWLIMDRSTAPAPALLVFHFLNMLCLLDVIIFLRSLVTLRERQKELVDLLEAVGSLDAAISVASYQTGLSCWTVPEINSDRQIQAKGLYHPLLSQPVSNPVHLPQRSALITGSNMAGKTTFIRTVGINVILARTLNFCLAERAILPKAVVKSSIRREDKLTEGQSYYFAELERLLEFLQAGESGPLYLFLIDEIFRGTNTVERVAASAAVLRELARQHTVVVTTHDLELNELLAEIYDMYHFSEQVVEGCCGFDYRIQPGSAKSRNAIRLLELNGYPELITREARIIAERLSVGFENQQQGLV